MHLLQQIEFPNHARMAPASTAQTGLPLQQPDPPLIGLRHNAIDFSRLGSIQKQPWLHVTRVQGLRYLLLTSLLYANDKKRVNLIEDQAKRQQKNKRCY